MIYVLYAIVALGVVLLSNKASQYVDLLDKKTSLSGAFLGGVMLSAVTSLPELFTSISSTLLLDKPGLCIGNILGSDLFNTAFLAIMFLVAFRSFGKSKISESHSYVALFVCFIYGAILLNWLGILDFNILTVSGTSLIIIALYILGIKHMSADNGDTPQEAEAEAESPLTLRQIVFRFVLVSIGIVALSIIITYITDEISIRLNLGAGLAGALFLGVATSLPEVSSTISLFRLKNHDIAIGNIVGSNLFNFLILSVADVIYIGNGIFDFSDPKTINLLVFGAIAVTAFLILLKWKNKATRIICPLVAIACYVAFLVV